MGTPYAHRRTVGLWMAAAISGAGYGPFLLTTAWRLGWGSELTGQFTAQPAVKALAVPIWWACAASLLLITAGFFFGRSSVPSATPAA
jgi:uncharacterized membrane protein YhhN